MANQLTKPIPIPIGKAVVYMKSTAVTVASASTLVSLFTATTDIQNHVKNLVITPPSSEVTLQPMIGETTSAKQPLQTFQNYIWDEKAFVAAKATGTVLVKPNEDPFDVMATGTGTAAVTASYTRRQYGGSDSGKTRKVGSILLLCPVSATDIRAFLLNNAWVNMGDIKGTGADGHLERDFELVCAPEDFVDDFLD